MINPGYLRWKLLQQQRAQDELITTAQDSADAAQSDASTGISDAATAQSTAETAQSFVDVALDQSTSAYGYTTAAASAGGKVATPSLRASGGNSLHVLASCATSGASISYRVNGGSWGAYSGMVTLTYGDILDAYATKGGLTDSDTSTWDTADFGP